MRKTKVCIYTHRCLGGRGEGENARVESQMFREYNKSPARARFNKLPRDKRLSRLRCAARFVLFFSFFFFFCLC